MYCVAACSTYLCEQPSRDKLVDMQSDRLLTVRAADGIHQVMHNHLNSGSREGYEVHEYMHPFRHIRRLLTWGGAVEDLSRRQAVSPVHDLSLLD